MTAERWRAIPGHVGYETNGVAIDDLKAEFRGIDRIITKSDGVRYTVKGKKLKISAHRPSGKPVVKLSTGRAGKGRWCFVHLLLAATFGEAAPANTNPAPANSDDHLTNSSKLQQAPTGWSA
jgi:hypothetical protein